MHETDSQQMQLTLFRLSKDKHSFSITDTDPYQLIYLSIYHGYVCVFV